MISIQKKIGVILTAILIISHPLHATTARPPAETTKVIAPASPDTVKWWQTSAERIAIYREVYHMAYEIIRQKVMAYHLKPHTWGVILDVDETILDNSAWQTEYLPKDKSLTWNDFAQKGVSKRIPFAKELLLAIHELGGNVNLVTNRPEFLREATLKNLRNQGLYFDQILLAKNDSETARNKNPRFQAIIQGLKPSKLKAQHIVAWFGDNIQDFPNIKQAEITKKDPESGVYNQFGVNYFALPNPMYGSWEKNS